MHRQGVGNVRRSRLVLAGAALLGAIAIAPGAIALIGFGGNGGQSSCSQGTPSNGSAPLNAGLMKAIQVDSGGDPRLAVSLLTGSFLESGWDNHDVGGGAFGPFQIQDPGVVNVGVTIVQAENPAFATNFMTPRYKEALRTVDPSLWSSDPETAAEQTAYAAEKPAGTYFSVRGKAAVDLAYSNAIAAMRKMAMSVTGFGGTAGSRTNFVAAPSGDTSAGCTGATPGDAKGLRAVVLKAAASQLGVPYVWGGTTRKAPGVAGGLDCSGLTMTSFQQAGIQLPRVSWDQWNATKSHTVATSMSQLRNAQPGDLIFFAGSDGTVTHPGHVAIVWGPNQMIVAPTTGENVQIQTINTPYWAAQLTGITDPYPVQAPSGKSQGTATAGSLPPTASGVLDGKVVLVDPGHNGGNAAAASVINRTIWNGRAREACDTTGAQTNSGFSEAEFNWNVARDLVAKLRAEGATVVLTRTSNTGVGPCVTQRAALGNNAHANAAVSIHADGGPPSGRGFAILTPVADGINNAIIGRSGVLGADLRNAFLSGTGEPVSNYDGVNGIQPRNDLGGTNLSTVPKVFIECANMRNSSDASKITSAQWQSAAAQAIAAGLTAFLTGH
jgi:N-acetylmuramoyl-L-alanine amidase